MLNPFAKGLSTGFILQMAIGPVFFYIMNLTLQKTLLDGLIAVAGVTLADYIFIALALIGAGNLIQKKSIARMLGILSSMILIIFGILIIVHILGKTGFSYKTIATTGSLFSSFISALILTLSSPLTIIFWTGLFAARAIEYNFSRKQLVVFGLSAGLPTLLFLGASAILLSFFKAAIPFLYVKILNLFIGMILIAYGFFRLVQVYRAKN